MSNLDNPQANARAHRIRQILLEKDNKAPLGEVYKKQVLAKAAAGEKFSQEEKEVLRQSRIDRARTVFDESLNVFPGESHGIHSESLNLDKREKLHNLYLDFLDKRADLPNSVRDSLEKGKREIKEKILINNEEVLSQLFSSGKDSRLQIYINLKLTEKQRSYIESVIKVYKANVEKLKSQSTQEEAKIKHFIADAKKQKALEELITVEVESEIVEEGYNKEFRNFEFNFFLPILIVIMINEDRFKSLASISLKEELDPETNKKKMILYVKGKKTDKASIEAGEYKYTDAANFGKVCIITETNVPRSFKEIEIENFLKEVGNRPGVREIIEENCQEHLKSLLAEAKKSHEEGYKHIYYDLDYINNTQKNQFYRNLSENLYKLLNSVAKNPTYLSSNNVFLKKVEKIYKDTLLQFEGSDSPALKSILGKLQVGTDIRVHGDYKITFSEGDILVRHSKLTELANEWTEYYEKLYKYLSSEKGKKVFDWIFKYNPQQMLKIARVGGKLIIEADTENYQNSKLINSRSDLRILVEELNKYGKDKEDKDKKNLRTIVLERLKKISTKSIDPKYIPDPNETDALKLLEQLKELRNKLKTEELKDPKNKFSKILYGLIADLENFFTSGIESNRMSDIALNYYLGILIYFYPGFQQKILAHLEQLESIFPNREDYKLSSPAQILRYFSNTAIDFYFTNS